MYQALYRKYRPLVFTDVVGQTAVTDTLRAQVSGGRLSHAYLFTGTRGTGKTTCAKILARAANCLSPVAGNPCNKCVPCLSALDGSLTDVMEIDAASNSGVDNIRALRDEAAYTPVSASKRVYIIDEVHMLSSGAFNALLKTLEEPPSYVLFILATTETHKVPATILSRCQRFAFRRLTENDISERLLYISKQENLDLTKPAAALLARLADGALRDGLSLLDQTAATSDGTIGENEVYQSLGLAGENAVSEWASAMAACDAQLSLSLFKEQIDLGRDISSLFGELSQILRDALLSKLEGGNERNEKLSALTSRELLDILSTVQDTLTKMSRSPQPRTEAELCVLKICGRNEAVPPRAETVTNAAPLKQQPAPKPEPKPVPRAEPASEPPQTKSVQKTAVISETPVPAAADFIQAAAGKLPPSLKSFLLNGQVEVEKAEGLWKLFVSDELTCNRLSDRNAVTILESVASDIAGHAVSVRVMRKEEPVKPKNPKLQMLLDNFES